MCKSWYQKALALVAMCACLLLTVPATAYAYVPLNQPEIKAAAQREVNAAQSEVDSLSAKATINELTFFQWMQSKGKAGGQEAVNVLTTSPILSNTKIGATGDATSWTNFKETLKWIKECNRLRAEAKTDPKTGAALGQLKVSPELMAIAAVQCNKSAVTLGHTQAYYVGENLFWGNFNPFGGWYWEEMANYKGTNVTDPSTGQTYAPEKDGQTGHYLNIVNSNYLTTGFAVNTVPGANRYGTTYGQTFDFNKPAYTTAEFEALVSEYENNPEIKGSADKLVAAQNRLNAAKAQLAAASQPNWCKDGARWRWWNGNSWSTGWVNTGGRWYWMDNSGVMKTGWVYTGGAWYYLNSDGSMATGWVKVGGTWYYLTGSGAMATGWVFTGGHWYYLDGSGAMATGWRWVGNAWYYLNGSGAMLTGWQWIGGAWYWMDGSGAMAANRWIGNYYVTGSGAMATNRWIGRWHVNGAGVWDATR